MKKIIVIIAVIFIFGAFLNNKENKEIRVRVIPLDNSEKSIAVKNEIVSKLSTILNEILDDDMSYTQMDKAIENNIDSISKELKIYDCKVKYIDYNFPTKAYNGSVIKSTKCKTLLVEVGNALGDNWWGTLYPDLLGISSTEKIEYRSIIKDFFGGE